MRPSSVVRTLVASARLVGFGAALCAFVLWVVLFISEARSLEQDFGITPATLLQSAIMGTLALVAACLRTVSLALVLISVISFVPVGFYLLLLSGYGSWIGVCNLLCLAAGLIMAAWNRLAGAGRRNAMG